MIARQSWRRQTSATGRSTGLDSFIKLIKVIKVIELIKLISRNSSKFAPILWALFSEVVQCAFTELSFSGKCDKRKRQNGQIKLLM